MLTAICPKLPMRNKTISKDYYIRHLGFKQLGNVEYDGYLMLERDGLEIHLFEHKDLNPAENYGQIYIRTNDIDALYQWMLIQQTPIHPKAPLQIKPWGQKEFSLLDPDNNLITFGGNV